MRLKRVLAVLLIICLAVCFLVAGCGAEKKAETTGDQPKTGEAASQKTETAKNENTAKDIKTEITVLSGPDRTDLEDIYKNAIAEFNKTYPNISVKLEIVPFENQNERMNVAIASNTPPSIFHCLNANLYDYINSGACVPIDDAIDEKLRNDIDQSIWNECIVNNKTYILPEYANVSGIAVNKTLFEQANALELLPLDRPDRTWTYDEYYKAAKAVTNKSKGIYGAGWYSGSKQADTHNFALLWGFGANTFDENGKVVLNSPEGVKALEFLLSMKDCYPEGAASLQGGDAINLFNQGKLGLNFATVLNLKNLEKAQEKGEAPKFESTLVMYPSADGTKPRTLVYNYGYIFLDTHDAAKIEAAKKWGVFWVLNQTDKFLPNAAPSIQSKAGAVKGDALWEYGMSIFKYNGNLGSKYRGYTEIRDVLWPELQAAYMEKKTAQQALDDFAKKANEIRDKYSK